MTPSTQSADDDNATLPSGERKREYFVFQSGPPADDVYVRLRRDQDAAITWEYDFLAAKDLTIRKTVRALECDRGIVREMVPDYDGKARAAFRKLQAA